MSGIPDTESRHGPPVLELPEQPFSQASSAVQLGSCCSGVDRQKGKSRGFIVTERRIISQKDNTMATHTSNLGRVRLYGIRQLKVTITSGANYLNANAKPASLGSENAGQDSYLGNVYFPPKYPIRHRRGICGHVSEGNRNVNRKTSAALYEKWRVI